jgi:hypothetical protein
LRRGWENHNNEVELMLRAILHAVGQVERPEEFRGGKHRMEIYVYNPAARKPEERMKKQDLYDLATTLSKRVEKQLDAGERVPDRVNYLTMLRMLEIIDKLNDPGVRNYNIVQDLHTGKHNKMDHEIIDWKLVDRDLFKFWTMEPNKRAALSPTPPGCKTQSLADRLTEKLLTIGVLELTQKDLVGLSENVLGAWNIAHTRDAQLREKDVPSGQFQKWGPGR